MDKLVVKKVLIRELTETLIRLLNEGMEYINITVEKGRFQDSIFFTESDPKDIKRTEEKITNFEDLI